MALRCCYYTGFPWIARLLSVYHPAAYVTLYCLIKRQTFGSVTNRGALFGCQLDITDTDQATTVAPREFTLH